MPAESIRLPHGSHQLPSVVIDSYNVELRDEAGGFLGDRASRRAFHAILEDWRERLRETDSEGDDPLGGEGGRHPDRRELEALLLEGDPEAAGTVLGTIETFAGELADVTRRFLRIRDWKGTQRIAVGGGLRSGRIGELAIGRATVLIKAEGGLDLSLVPIRHHPDEAGLIGAAHLMPAWMFSGHDGLLAVDIGGSKIRAGLVALNLDGAADLSRAEVRTSALWRHHDGTGSEKPSRDEAVERLAGMLRDLIAGAGKEGIKLAPFVGVGCPGLIREDGGIERGGQNLPGGNWESSRFNLARALREAVPVIDGHETMVLVHNDAVVQGLSQTPFMQDVERWGVVTIGTGFGNARFTNRGPAA